MKRSLIIFYCLLVYASAELIWWGILLIKSEPDRKEMIIGEGCVFFFIFLIGAIQLQRTFNKEFRLHVQQKNFLLSVTHELKSPLSSIKLHLQTILKRDLSIEKQRYFLGNSLKDVERLEDLIEKMLIATKIENDSYSFPKEKIDFSELSKEVVSRLQELYAKSRRIIYQIDPSLYIIGDKFALTLVMSNLIENALKYSSTDALIQLKASRDKGMVTCEIIDQGVGIPTHEKAHIFEKFYRIGNEQTRTTKGTGLGLYIVKQVLDKHQAQIIVKDNNPKGTIFKILFNES